jgi:hypothetical protein
VEAGRGPRWITITWNAPEHGDLPITGYRIRRYFADTGGLSKTDVVGDVGFFNAVDVKQGRLYRFDVTAINASGTGRPSVRTAAVSAADVPGSPRIGTATSGTEGGAITATATWSPPSSDHGSPITGYLVVAFHVNSAGDILDTTESAIQPASARSLTMTLPVSGTYRFKVHALNEVGQSPISAQSNKVTAR